jgi:signal peptidase II
MIKNKKTFYIGLAITAVVILIDQLSKIYMLGLLKDVRNINIWPFFDLTLVYNRGISFGMLNGGGTVEIAIIALITSVIVIALTNWLLKTGSLYKSTCIGLIIGGAIGNVIDRFTQPGVVDFLDFHMGKHHYPAFNVADSCICVAVVLLLLENILVKEIKK